MTDIDTDSIKLQADCVAMWQNRLKEATSHLARIRALNGQTGYSISIGGRSIAVATMDSRTYNAVMIRGMEMIHLGALKALAAEIDGIERWLVFEKEKLANMTANGAKP